MAALLVFVVILGLQGGFMADPSDWGPLLLLASLVGVALRFSLQRNRTLQQLREREETYRLLAENASDVVFRIDPQGQLEWVSPSVESMLGWTPAELQGRSVFSLIHPDDAGSVSQSWLICTSDRRTRTQYRIVDREGRSRWVSVSCRALTDARSQLLGRIGSWSDAQEEMEARSRLLDQRQLLETILDNVDSHIYMKDGEHRYLYANRRVQEMFGRSLAEIVGQSDRALFPEAELAALWNFDEEVFESDHPLQREELLPSAAGQPRWFLSNKLKLQQNDSTCLIGFSTDITDRRRAELELERSESKFRLLFEASLDAILLVRGDGHFLDANPAVLHIYGASSKEDFLRCTPADFSPEFQPDGSRSADLIAANIACAFEAGTHQFEWLHRRLDTGETFLGLVTLRAVQLDDQPALLSVVRDISESRRLEERLRQLAYRDALTDLPNRAASLEHLEQRLARLDSGAPAAGEARGLVLVNLDFDRFQAVNDSFGLEVGNRVLIAAALSLRRWLGPHDWLARLESDEFLVVRALPGADAETALQFGRDLQEALAEGLRRDHADLPIHPSTTAGLSLAPAHGSQPITLLQAANTALMEAKRGSQQQLCLYRPELSTTIQQCLDLEMQLQRALERDELSLLFQPEVDGSGRITGAEALLRWTLADGRQVSPDVFIPLAEQTGLIHPIGNWLIDSACRQLASWRRMGVRLPRLAINLSAVQFERRQSDLDAWLMAAMSRHGISPVQLELEVTETALLRYPESARALLYQLGAAGFCIAIDDFGTGYSSLVNLHTLPVHKLKIDKSFVQRITDGGTSCAIIDSTLVIARKLGLQTIAEGVETAGQWQLLKELGCQSFQGYLFGRPMTAEQLVERLRSER